MMRRLHKESNDIEVKNSFIIENTRYNNLICKYILINNLFLC
jgi:hypothetical protein